MTIFLGVVLGSLALGITGNLQNIYLGKQRVMTTKDMVLKTALQIVLLVWAAILLSTI